MISYYNSTKSGVDVLDKLVRTYSCKRGTDRWTVAFFFNLIDVAAYNALVLWITANPNWHRGKSHARRLFLRELGMSLTNSHASERLTQPSGKRRRIQACVRRSGILADRSSLASSKSSGDGRRQRCNACPRQLERKTSRSCHTCGVPICKDHSTVLMTCLECAEEAGPSIHFGRLGDTFWSTG